MIWFKFYTVWSTGIAELSDAEAGRFIKAICSHAEGGEIPALSGNERVLYAMASRQLEQDKEKSERTSSARSEAGRIGGMNSSKQKQANESNCLNDEAIAKQNKQMQANALNKNKELRIKKLEEELREGDESAEPIHKAPAKTKSAEPKHQHGQFKNVLLTDKEFQELHEKFSDADARIESFSLSKQAKGYTYKSDYAAILKWAEKDAKQQTVQPKLIQSEPYKSTYQRLKEMGEI